MPVGAAIGAVGSVGGALITSNAANSAADQQAASQREALAQQQRMFAVAQKNLQPFVDSGQSVLPTLQGLLTPGANQTATLQQTPGFQFNSQYGTMAAQNALSTKSGASAGPLATAVSQYNQGLAGNTWQSVVNALQGFANTGANSAGNLAGGAISSGNAQANTLGNIGNAQASGTLGSANALAGGLSGVSGAGTNALLLSKILGNNGTSTNNTSGIGLFSGTPDPNAAGLPGSPYFGPAGP